MSLTQAHHAFAAISQEGLNEALAAFFSARPHYLHYGSPPFVVASSVTTTLIDPIPFPNTPGGISWAVDFSVPTVDLFPPDGALPPPLTLIAGQLALATTVVLTIGCRVGEDPKGERGGRVVPLQTALPVVAVGHPVSRFFSPGVGDISFAVDAVSVQGVKPDSLGALLDCLVRMMLNAFLGDVRLPFDLIDAGFFKLALEEGPLVADDQITLRGDVS
jgi:hypothetical protein